MPDMKQKTMWYRDTEGWILLMMILWVFFAGYKSYSSYLNPTSDDAFVGWFMSAILMIASTATVIMFKTRMDWYKELYENLRDKNE